jgi:SAM-dependent methyltransferase
MWRVNVAQAAGNRANRTIERLREHYEIEKELAGRLRSASRQDRRSLYTSLYNELFQRVPDHPQLTRKASVERTQTIVAAQMRILDRFLSRESTFLEVGPGDCSLSLEVAQHVRQVIAVDVSDEITKGVAAPRNFRLVISDGCSIPVPRESVDIAYSHQLMEHLHPDDAMEQLQNIHYALAHGGVYICITPNRLSGPHDISRYFDPVASGFHLKEYTNTELRRLFLQVGFSTVRACVEEYDHFNLIHPSSIIIYEALLRLLPHRLRRRVAGGPRMRRLLGVQLVGIK